DPFPGAGAEAARGRDRAGRDGGRRVCCAGRSHAREVHGEVRRTVDGRGRGAHDRRGRAGGDRARNVGDRAGRERRGRGTAVSREGGSPPRELGEARGKFLELVAEIRPELHRYCARLTGSVVEGEDVVQETLAKAYYAISMAPEMPPLRPFLF